MSDRRGALDVLYALLDDVARRTGGPRKLSACSGRMPWPERGVYFFYEDGEVLEDGITPRVVRVGTHAVSAGSKTSLWHRLSQHRGATGGSRPGGGNHRASIFRRHVGAAMLNTPAPQCGTCPTWGVGSSAQRATREAEYEIEQAVSRFVGAMGFLWVGVDDAAGRESDRKVIERNAIALLSNRSKPAVDSPSSGWLGRYSIAPEIRESGLWNVQHVDDPSDTVWLLDALERYVQQTSA